MNNNKTISQKENAKDLERWMGEVRVEYTDAVLEFLEDRELLNEQGIRVSKKFWELYIKK